MTRPLAITVGDPAGIGPEVCLDALGRLLLSHNAPLPEIRLIAPHSLIERSLHLLDSSGRERHARAVRSQLGETIQVVVPSARPAGLPGGWDRAQAPFVRESLDLGIELAESGFALVTGPADKRFFVEEGLDLAGHTEYLADRYPGHEPLMLFEAGGFRVAVLTRHIPLSQVTDAVTEDRLVVAARTAFGFVTEQETSPRPMAIAALDPHCGEWGAFSSADLEVKNWATVLSRDGIPLHGPVAADTLFVPTRLADYSAVLCWYHDQGMIPVKLLHFDRAVNVTLGLPILRVSPAHGVAFDIAWQGRADSSSFLAACECALGVGTEAKHA